MFLTARRRCCTLPPLHLQRLSISGVEPPPESVLHLLGRELVYLKLHKATLAHLLSAQSVPRFPKLRTLIVGADHGCALDFHALSRACPVLSTLHAPDCTLDALVLGNADVFPCLRDIFFAGLSAEVDLDEHRDSERRALEGPWAGS